MSDTEEHRAGARHYRLASKVVVVTGAAQGIGRAIALRCADEGASVVLVDQNESGLQEAAQALEASADAGQGVTCSVVQGDISQESTVRNMIDAALERHGRLDGLVNNAGILGPITRFEIIASTVLIS